MRWLALALLLSVAPAAAQAPAESDLAAVAALVEQGRLADAETRLRRLLEQREEPRARDLLGVVLSRRGELDAAERQFRRALELDPALQPARQHLGRLHLQRQEAERAKTELRAAAELGPLERDLALALAEMEEADGNLPRAEALLESAAERYGSVQALVRLARGRATRGDAEAAAAALRRALELAPNSEEVLGAYARISLGGNSPAAAIRALEPLARMHPTVAEYPYLLGVARMQIGELDGAVAALERSLELEPQRTLTLVALGMAFNTQKRFGEASAVLQRALETEPGGVEALASLAEAEEGLGELDAAEAHAARALSSRPSHHRARLVLGLVRMKQQRYAEARDELLRALDADPTAAKAHYQLSLAYARLDDPEASRRHLELYRETLRVAEERLIELRTQAGLGMSGMKQ